MMLHSCAPVCVGCSRGSAAQPLPRPIAPTPPAPIRQQTALRHGAARQAAAQSPAPAAVSRGQRLLSRAQSPTDSTFTQAESKSPTQSGQDASQSSTLSGSLDGEYGGECFPGWVTVSNQEHPQYTKVTVDVGDYGGLLRTISWVLSGSEVCVQHAVINTKDDFAHNEYWVTNMKGKKLSDQNAAILQEVLQSFIIFCKPRMKSPQNWASSNVRISNTANDQYSVITVYGDPKIKERYGAVLKEEFLFELCSLITSSGCVVKQGQVIGSDSPPPGVKECVNCKECTAEQEDIPYDFSLGPMYRFCVTDIDGRKLGPSEATSFLTMYNIIRGSGNMPFTAPNQDEYYNLAVGAVDLK